MSYPWETTLVEARRYWTEHLDEGVTCPCCERYDKRYKRSLNSGMARSLIRIYKKGKLGWVYIPEMLLRSSEEGKLAYWGLLEEANAVREDGGHAGWWRVTSKGESFVNYNLLVPKFAVVLHGHCEKLDGEMVNIQDCLGDKFDLRDLMR